MASAFGQRGTVPVEPRGVGGLCGGKAPTILGSSGADDLAGTPGADVVLALGGNDDFSGAGGADVVCGGGGDDDLEGTGGKDLLIGGRDNDDLAGGNGNDRLRGSRGDDDLDGDSGNDRLGGGPGTDDCADDEGDNRRRACEQVDGEGDDGGGGGGDDEPPKNKAPTAADDADATGEDAARAINVLANDTDADGDALEVKSIATSGTQGAVAIAGGSSVIGYDPSGRFNSLAAGATATDTFTYVASDGEGGSDAATVTVTVNGSDDAPSAVDDAATLAEDSGASAIQVLPNDNDVDGGPKSIASKTDGAHGTVAITGGGTGLTYSPNPDYCGADVFSYSLNGGSTATVAVTVTCSQDVPSAVDDSRTVTEDAAATNFDVLSNDADVDGDSLEITNATDPANGTTSVVQGTPDQVAYTPDPNYCNDGAPPDDDFDYTIDDGHGGTDTATVSVAVTCVAEPPVVDLNGAAAGIDTNAGFTEDGGPVTLAAATTVADVDDTNLESATVAITNLQDGADESLDATTAGTSITATYNSAAGELELTGTETLANYQQVLRTVDYDNADQDPGTAARTIEFVANDGDGDSPVATANVSVSPVNDAPSADLNGAAAGNGANASFTEDAGPVTLASAATTSDPDDTNLEAANVAITNLQDGASESLAAATAGTSISAAYTPGTGVLALTGADTVANYQQVLRTVAYDNSSDTPNTTDRSITFVLDDGDASSNTATATVSVAAANDAPSVDLNGAAAGIDTNAGFTEDGGPVALAPTSTAADPDDANLEEATATITNLQDGAAESLEANTAGTGIAASYSPGTGTLTLSGSDTIANYQQVLRTVAYDNASNTPATAARSITFEVDDGDASSATATATLSVALANDAPTVDLNGAAAGIDATATFNEPGPAVSIAGAAVVSDPDDTNIESAEITLTNRPNGAAETLSVDTTGTSIAAAAYDSGTGVLALSGTDTVANYQQVLRTVAYDNSAAPPNSTDRAVEFSANDGSADSPLATSIVSVVPLNEPPDLDLNGAAAGIDTSASFTEDGGAIALASATTLLDADDTNLESVTVTITNLQDGAAESLAATTAGTSINASYTAATGVLDLTGTDTLANYQQVVRSVAYDNTSDTPDTTVRSIDFVGNDGQDDSPTAAATVSVAAANDAPSVDLNGVAAGINTTATFTEDAGPITLAGSAVVGDVDDANLESATITLTNRPDGADEELAVDTAGTSIVAAAYVPGTGILALSGTDTLANYQQVLRTVDYDNADQDPNTTDRSVTFKANDGSADSPDATATVTIVAQNDAPVVDLNGAAAGIDTSVAFTEDSAPANPGSGPAQLGPGATATDIDNANLQGATLTLTNRPDGAAESLAVNTAGTTVVASAYNSGTGALTLSGNRPKAEYQQVIQTLTYNNTSNTPNTTDRDVTVEITDGSLSSAVAHSTVSVTATNDAPNATDDALNGADSAIGNTPLAVGVTQAEPRKALDCSVPGNCSVLTRGTDDSDPDGPGPLTVGPTGAQAITTADGGKVTLEADGNFTYFPAANDPGCADASDSFDYTLSDGGTNGTDTGTVTIAVANCAWYLDSSVAGPGTGTATDPFKALTGTSVSGAGGAGDADGAGDTIMFLDAASYPGGLPLENSQLLRSERAGLTVGGNTIVTAAGATNPTISNASGNALTLASGNTIQGIDLGSTNAGSASLAGSVVGTATMNTSTSGSIANASGGAVNISGGTVNMTLSSVSSTGATNDGIRLDNTQGAFTGSAGSLQTAGGQDVDISGTHTADDVNFTYDGSITDDVGQLVNVSGQSGGIKDFNGQITDGNDGDGSGVSLSGNTGATVRFDGGLILSTGATNAFAATGGGTVNVVDPNAVGTAPDNTISTTTGIPLTVTGTTVGAGNLNFRSISSSGAPNGIVLNGTGSSGGLRVVGNGGSCTSAATCTGGAIENATGDAVKLTSANDTVLTDMRITSSDGSWIDAASVDGLNLTRISADSSTDDGFLGSSVRDLVITGGTYFGGGKDGEPTCNINGFDITNLLGTSSITGTTFQRANTIQFRVNNNTATSFGGAPDTLTVSGTNWNNHAGPCGGDHLSVNADTGGNFRVTTNATAGVNVVSTGGIGVQATSGGTNGKMDASVTGLRTSGNTAGAAFAATAGGSITYDVFDNNADPAGTADDTGFSGTGSLALAEVCTTTASCVGTWDNNTIVHTAGPGTDAMQAVLEGNGTATIAITNNEITGNFQRGINLSSGGGTGAAGTLNATVAGNMVTGSDPASLQGINITSGLSGSPGNGETNKLCLNLFGNASSQASGLAGYRLTNRASNVFQLQDFSGSGASDTDITNWVNNAPKSNTGTVAIQNDPATFGPLSAAPGNCPTPP